MCSWTLFLSYQIMIATDQYLNNSRRQIVDILCALERCFYIIRSLVQQMNSWTIQVVRRSIKYVLLTTLPCNLIMIATDQYLNNSRRQIVDILCALERCCCVIWSRLQQINIWTIQVVRSLIYYGLLNVVPVLSDDDCNRSIFEQSKKSDRRYTICSWTLLLCYLIISATDQYLNNPSRQMVDTLCALERCCCVIWSLVHRINTWTMQGVGWLIYYVLLNVVAVLSDH
jgi:hypothetical protein